MNENMNPNCTDFLYSDPSFLQGMGTILNLGGNYYTFNYSDTPQEADSKALASDWGMIGKDLKDVFRSLAEVE
jgi:hypothetical protein